MFSSDPSVITRKEKMDKEEAVRAIRGALMAELDAINYYLQQGKLFNQDFIKKVHDDIAKEEITHFGEFLRLLYETSKEDFEYMVKGWNEASKLIGSNPSFPITLSSTLEEKAQKENQDMNVEYFIAKALEERKIRNYGTILKYGDESISIYDLEDTGNKLIQKDNSSLYKIEHLNVEFEIRSDLSITRTMDIIYKAGLKYSKLEDLLLLSNHPLSLSERGIKEKPSDWEIPGNIAFDIIKSMETIESSGYSDIAVVISPSLYAKLFRVYDKTGSYEIELLRHCCEMIVSPYLSGLIVFSKKGFYILENSPASVEFLGKEGVYSDYLISGKISPYLIDSNAAMILK
ncbi:encapsulin [Acidianus brierleyi]|uniref:Ferritin n=1 Tax=Acidianus brierleyi TaxID=41673 RepID=A0A2U9IG90_9CREN|nr:encapsulin [Acidianus brierleyi]AWR95058.1 ferritin [Acidianus brierleyi]